ncbi:hypothetical protein C8J56DRAFT_36990 [Mycena floridula]|nr:hypothetical protein C8J56DRAFT_36990 [Mycena floridula]
MSVYGGEIWLYKTRENRGGEFIVEPMLLFILANAFCIHLVHAVILLSAPSTAALGQPLLVSWTRTSVDPNEFILLSVNSSITQDPKNLVYEYAVPVVYVETGSAMAGHKNITMTTPGRHVLAALDPASRNLLGNTDIIQTTIQKSPERSTRTNMTAIIIGSSLAGAVLFFLVLGLVIYWHRRHPSTAFSFPRRLMTAKKGMPGWAVLPEMTTKEPAVKT